MYHEQIQFLFITGNGIRQIARPTTENSQL